MKAEVAQHLQRAKGLIQVAGELIGLAYPADSVSRILLRDVAFGHRRVERAWH